VSTLCVLLQQACSAASKAELGTECVLTSSPTAGSCSVLQAKWYMEDAWDILIRHRVPQGVTREQVVRVWFDEISESRSSACHLPWRKLFTDLPPHMVTPLIRAKLNEHDAEVQAAKEIAEAAVTLH